MVCVGKLGQRQFVEMRKIICAMCEAIANSITQRKSFIVLFGSKKPTEKTCRGKGYNFLHFDIATKVTSYLMKELGIKYEYKR